MVDTHCHLTFPPLARELPRVLARARTAGVTRFINPGTDLEQSRAAVALAEREPDVFAAVGVHPQDVGRCTEEVFAELRELAWHPKVVAIGEVGLEWSRRSPAPDLQEHWLQRFVELAAEVEKPLIFHVRDAHAEFREFLTKAPMELRGVVHCFSGDANDAEFYTRAPGLILGITGIVTYPNAQTLRGVIGSVPLAQLLLETDAPFLAPQSHRGERNEPAFLREIAGALAELRTISLAEVARVTDVSARRLFALPL